MNIIELQTSIRSLLLTIPNIIEVYGQWASPINSNTQPYPYIGQQYITDSDDLDAVTRQQITYKVHIWALTPDQILDISQQVYDLLHRNHSMIEGVSRFVHIQTSDILSENNNTLFHNVLTFLINTRF